MDCLRGRESDVVRDSREYRSRLSLSAMANVSSITRIEWATPGTILISWSDSTLGRYQDQLWRAGFAHASSVCGLTGATVRRGDAVFRPVARVRDRPVNVSDVILAEGLWRRGCGGSGMLLGIRGSVALDWLLSASRRFLPGKTGLNYEVDLPSPSFGRLNARTSATAAAARKTKLSAQAAVSTESDIPGDPLPPLAPATLAMVTSKPRSGAATRYANAESSSRRRDRKAQISCEFRFIAATLMGRYAIEKTL